MKKIFIGLISLLLLVGCSPKELKDSYGKMQEEENKMTNYNIDLRIYGTVEGTELNESVKITKYNNDYEILIKNVNDSHNTNEEEQNKEMPVVGEAGGLTVYIKDNKTYALNTSGKYAEYADSNYNNPSVYLIGLDNIKEVMVERDEKIGEQAYHVYEVTFDKNIMNQVLEETPVSFRTDKDGRGIIYIDKDGYVYRIIYKIDDLTINANYYGINNVKPIKFPL